MMRELLKEISVIPGVTGSCIFDKKEGSLCQDKHSTLSAELLETVGINLVRLIQIGGISGFNVKTAHFRFDKYTVVGLPLDSGSVLLTICEAQANCSLIATTAAMLASDMRGELESGVAVPEPVVPDEVEEEVELELIEVEDEGKDLQPVLDNIEEALAGAIGPVAGMVMQDYVDKWKEAGAVVPARLSELAKMLVTEIGEPDLAKEFLAKVETIM